jgi:hypothetical protein
MAIIVTSGLISHIKGSMAGSTFQRSASGLTMRKKPLPVGRGTNSQLNQRNIVAQLNVAWNLLTDAQRLLWASFSNYTNGQGKTNKQNTSANTGKTQFVAVNSWLLLYGKALLQVPTLVPPEAAISPLYNAAYESNNLGQTVGSLDTTSQILVVQVSLPQSVGTVTNNTGFRTLVYYMVDGNIQDWSAEYQATYGVPLTVGSKYWVQTFVVNFITGAISAKSKALIKYINPSSLGIGSMIIESTFIVG